MKKVSVIIPCYNEEKYIHHVITDLVQQDYPKEFIEVFFIDGMSTDNTADIIRENMAKFSWIKMLANTKRYVSNAMNLGIEESNGDIIMRMDAHASYPQDYISKLIAWMEKLDADNVGGLWRTQSLSETAKAKAIALALSHPFGVGNSYFRIGIDSPREVDTVPFGCYKRNVFDKIGMYDTRLIRNQDIELNKRLKAVGGKIFLVPDVYCIYYARETFKKLASNNFKNGEWVILASFYTKTLSSLSLRHFIPLFFIGYLILLPMLNFLSQLCLIPFIFYIFLIIFISLQTSLKKKNLVLSPLLSFAFLVLHISYGAGSFYGIWRVLIKKV